MNIIMVASVIALLRGRKCGVDPFLTALLLWGLFQAILSTFNLPAWLTLQIFLLGLVLFMAPIAGILLMLLQKGGHSPRAAGRDGLLRLLAPNEEDHQNGHEHWIFENERGPDWRETAVNLGVRQHVTHFSPGGPKTDAPDGPGSRMLNPPGP
jgi:hypothetical protein